MAVAPQRGTSLSTRLARRAWRRGYLPGRHHLPATASFKPGAALANDTRQPTKQATSRWWRPGPPMVSTSSLRIVIARPTTCDPYPPNLAGVVTVVIRVRGHA